MKISRDNMQDKINSKHHTQDNITKKDGFDFAFNTGKCSECGGKCCYGESGYIFASIAEIEKIECFFKYTF